MVRGAQTRLSSLFFFRRRVGPCYVFASLYSFSTLSLRRFSLRIGCRLLCTSSFRTSILVRWLILFINLKHLFELLLDLLVIKGSLVKQVHQVSVDLLEVVFLLWAFLYRVKADWIKEKAVADDASCKCLADCDRLL